ATMCASATPLVASILRSSSSGKGRSFLPAAARLPSHSSSSAPASPEPDSLGPQLVRVVRDPDDGVLEALGRLGGCGQSPEPGAGAASGDERAGSRDRPGPRGTGVECAWKVGLVPGRRSHRREGAAAVSFVELRLVAGLEELETKVAVRYRS